MKKYQETTFTDPSTKKVLRVAYYIRVSTAEQVSRDNSLPAQRAALDAWTEANGAKCVGEYADEGRSASKQLHKRKGILQLVQDIRDDKIDLVIFTRFDRFTRNPADYFKVMETFNAKGVQWKAIDQPELDLNTNMGQMMIMFYLGINKQESNNISERGKATAAVRIQKRLPVTGAHCMPFSHTTGVDEKGQKVVIRNPETEHIVWAYIDHYEQHHSKRAATIHVNETLGVSYQYNQYKRMLENTFMYGHYKGVDNYCEAYVTKERWETWQELNKKNLWLRSSEKDIIYIFSQLMTCHTCGRRMVGSSTDKPKKTYYYYRCNHARISGLCDHTKSHNEERIEKYLLSQVKPEIEKYITEYEIALAKPANRPKVDKVKKLEKELERVNYQFQKDRISIEKYDEQYEDLTKRIAEAKAEQAHEEIPAPKDLDSLKALLDMDLLTVYPDLTRTEKRILWRSVIDTISISPDGKITVKFL